MPVAGEWVILSQKGEILAKAPPSGTFDQVFVPPENGLWEICGQKVQLVMPYIVGEQPNHLEGGYEEAPCTWLGDCDEGLACVEVSMAHRQCVSHSRIPEGAKIVKGPQPAAPYDNCWYAPADNKCAVKGFTCYKNSQWENFAQCRPEGDCPLGALSLCRDIPALSLLLSHECGGSVSADGRLRRGEQGGTAKVAVEAVLQSWYVGRVCDTQTGRARLISRLAEEREAAASCEGGAKSAEGEHGGGSGGSSGAST
uniref:Uncharacterized protein n=1 Tax=Chromera velia CCMP2878 TaxID=1169474 RepID=A0A0G4HE82_9ALVE|eukprot:Cvel_26705.t1-p1 / transcript=Cvel_26705.t1 / gene=Cvel_26705 / organism=Chromera_velia_CCMP2878 / gene_product=hypothetical protein / transcript_product=hypothetical protein / location=Cvel_scaffold3218:11956-13486(+) / protein_length=254 / sequence_SO=supercontig / SO=protein_coding / is_pseudo=false